MKKIIVLLVVFMSFNSIAFSRSLYVDSEVEKYKEYNPDGQKYKFVRSYINALSYIYMNNLKNEENNSLSFEYLQNISNLVKLRDSLVMNNINLRVARNFIKKYNNSENGLILKVTDVFTTLCDGLIALNDKEKNFYNSLYEKKLDSNEGINRDEVFDWKLYSNKQRKEIMMSLLESSMLVTKVLISDKLDNYGELGYLGITDSQKYSLLLLLDGFQGEEYQGELREGQSFLAGSVSIIRGILEDDNYNTLGR